VLHFASAFGIEDIVSFLLDNGAAPGLYDDDGYLPLYPALSRGYCNIALCFLKYCSSLKSLIVVQSTQSTALHIACRFACLEVVLFLWKQDVDIDPIDFVGRTALQEALSQNNPLLEHEVVQTVYYFVEYGARDDFETSAQMACTYKFPDVQRVFDPHQGKSRPISPGP
jgi:ankyrin repeat protein